MDPQRQRHEEIHDARHDGRGRQREEPRGDDAARDAPANRGETLRATHAHDRRRHDLRRRDGGVDDVGAQVQDRGGHGLGGEAASRIQVDDLAANGAHDAPTAGHRAQRNRRGARELHPQGNVHFASDGIEDVMRLAVAAGHQRHDDDAHRLLRVLDAVAQGHGGRGDALGGTETTHRAVVLRLAQQPQDEFHDEVSDDEADDGGGEHRDDDVADNAFPEHLRTAEEARADHAADEGVRRGRGQAEPPGDQVPDAGAQQGGQDDDQALLLHVGRGGFGVAANLNDARTDGLGDAGAHHGTDDVHRRRHEECSAGSPRARRHGGGDRVRRVVEAVRVAEEQRDDDDDADEDQIQIHGSGFLQCEGLDDVGQLLEGVGAGFEALDDVLQLDDRDRVEARVE